MKNWTNITLQEVETINELNKIEIATKRKGEICKVLTGQDVDKMLVIDMLELYNEATAFMAEEPIPVKVGELVIDGEKFRPLLQFTEWSTARMISYHNTLIAQPDNIALQVAILLDGDYDAKELERREDLIRTKAPYNQIYSLSLFFWKVFNSYVKAMEAYSKQMMMPSRIHTTNIGGGTLPSTQRQREIYSPSES
jgi:hypothetical protein